MHCSEILQINFSMGTIVPVLYPLEITATIRSCIFYMTISTLKARDHWVHRPTISFVWSSIIAGGNAMKDQSSIVFEFWGETPYSFPQRWRMLCSHAIRCSFVRPVHLQTCSENIHVNTLLAKIQCRSHWTQCVDTYCTIVQFIKLGFTLQWGEHSMFLPLCSNTMIAP